MRGRPVEGQRVTRRLLLVAIVLATSWAASGAPQYSPQYTVRAAGPYAGPTHSGAWIATPKRPVSARVEPTPRSRSLALLGSRTPARNVARYLVTDSSRVGSTVWVQVLLSGGERPVSGWVPATAVSVTRTSTRIELRLRTHSLVLLRAGRPLLRTWIATGREGTSTPSGLFAVREVVRHGRIVARALGPSAVSLTATTPMPNDVASVDNRLAIVGLGRNSRRLLRRDTTLGSVRVTDRVLTRIARAARAGTPVLIRE